MKLQSKQIALLQKKSKIVEKIFRGDPFTDDDLNKRQDSSTEKNGLTYFVFFM